MNINLKQSLIATVGIAVIFLSSCSKDKHVTPEEPVIPAKGVYILNEGSMGSDNSSLSYLDFGTNKVTTNIFSANNKDQTLGAGASDMDIYGSLLFIAVTESDKVEILDASTAKVIKKVDVTEPRYIAFHSGKAFITTYGNKVVVIDTLTKALVGNGIPVGNTPEHIVVSGNKLYVANSGYHDVMAGGAYESTVSVIDPVTLKEESKIKVDDNVYHLFADGKGNIYGNTVDIFNPDWSAIINPSHLFRINTSTNKVDKAFNFGILHMAFYQDQAIFISNNYEEDTNLYTMNLSSLEPKKLDIIKTGDLNDPNFPYALSVNPENGDLWYAKSDYTNPGTIFHYRNGSKDVKNYTVGLNPSVFVFK